MNRRFLHVVFAASLGVAALLSSGCNFSSRAAVKSEKERKKAPEFSLKDANGKSVKLSDYKGKVVLLNFWATWCGPCKLEIPWFISFEQQYKDRGFAVLGVSMDEDGWEAVKPYITERKINYRILMGNDSVAQLYGGVDSLPTSFILDRDGRVAAVHVGLVSKSVYQNDIDNLVAADPSTGVPGSSRSAD